ncbi:MAG: RluA family pseudouridine synthase [Alphaproteobacteria bacterium]
MKKDGPHRPAARGAHYRVAAAGTDSGARLDKLLAAAIPALSRTRLKSLIEGGKVTRGGVTITDPSLRVKPGETFQVSVPPAVAAAPEPEAIALTVVYEDDDVIVVDKPPGLVVHPAPGNREHTLVNALLAHCRGSLSGIGGVARPGIVHRLDKDTSGLMVVAKTDRAHAALAEQFAARKIARAYYAVVWGVPEPKSGEIAGNIGRSPRNRKKMAVVRRGGKPALTRYRVVRRLGSLASLVECRLMTGRTHQIRVHLAAIGHPIIGDRTYGDRTHGGGHRVHPKGAEARIKDVVRGFGRQALHAYLIGFQHPSDRRVLRFVSDLPPDINALIGFLEDL